MSCPPERWAVANEIAVIAKPKASAVHIPQLALIWRRSLSSWKFWVLVLPAIVWERSPRWKGLVGEARELKEVAVPQPAK